MKIIYRAYLLLLIAILITAFISKGITIDIHIHDTKFVIAHFYISLWLSFYVLLLTIANYWISKYRGRTSLLQWLVFLITVLVCLWILFASLFQSTRFYGRTFDIDTWSKFNQFQKINEITSILTFLFILAQLSFWIYFLILLIRKFLFRLHKN